MSDLQVICEGHPQLANTSPGVQWCLNRPALLCEPVLSGASPVDAGGASIYGSVIRDGGVFRMWYQAWPDDWDGRDVGVVACAESDDGLNWRRPAYGVMPYRGSTQNHLTNLPFHSPSVFLDPQADSAARYRAFGCGGERYVREGHPQGIVQYGYYTAHSGDGLRWELDSTEPFWPWADVITSVWDPYRGCARIAAKRGRPYRGVGRRSVYTLEWRDGKFTEPVSALIPDEYDDLQAQMRGFNSADYYGMGWLPTAGPTLGILWNFRHMLPLHPERWGQIGRVDLSLVYQTEPGGRWQHVAGRPDWLCAEEAPVWAQGGLYTSAYPLDVGEETWLYLTGALDRHGWAGHRVGLQQDAQAEATSNLERGGFARIGLVKWRKNRLLGVRALHPELVQLSPAASAGGAGRLTLNVKTDPEGWVRAWILDGEAGEPIPGYEAEHCEVISGDHLQAEVRWSGQSQLPRQSEYPQALAQIELRRAMLYAFDFTLAETG